MNNVIHDARKYDVNILNPLTEIGCFICTVLRKIPRWIHRRGITSVACGVTKIACFTGSSHVGCIRFGRGRSYFDVTKGPKLFICFVLVHGTLSDFPFQVWKTVLKTRLCERIFQYKICLFTYFLELFLPLKSHITLIVDIPALTSLCLRTNCRPVNGLYMILSTNNGYFFKQN